ncbi:unnamed protein product [Calicophoron daubneyi]|uniref:Uncharacterized protein n=1 Tax=Calicophoron daubneyi TaxID=300641 RepID=A0AAV2T2M3_CALDB
MEGRQTRSVIFESIARILEQSHINIERIPSSDGAKRIVTDLIDLSKNSRHLYEDLFGHGSTKNINIEDAASRIFGDEIKWKKIAQSLQFAACCYTAYKRCDIVMFAGTVAYHYERFKIQEWIENQGGWKAVLPANRTAIALGALGAVGALAMGGIVYNGMRRN